MVRIRFPPAVSLAKLEAARGLTASFSWPERDAVYQLAALTVGAWLALADA